MEQDKKTQLLDLSEVARRLGMSLRTIREWARKRKIPTIKLPKRLVRVSEADLEKFIADCKAATADQK